MSSSGTKKAAGSKSPQPSSGGGPSSKRAKKSSGRLNEIPARTTERFSRQSAVDDIVKYFREHGYVVIEGVLSRTQCGQHIIEQIVEILQKQRWTRTLTVVDPLDGRTLDVHADARRYLEVITSSDIPSDVWARYREEWTLHRGFGACCDPSVFHLALVWLVRQDPFLYAVASAIIECKHLWVDINRSIHKLPGEGEEEFLHWDIPFFTDFVSVLTAISGKVMYTPGELVVVPGTHTKDSHRDIYYYYRPLYPNAKPTDAKTALDPEKEDVLDLFGKAIAVELPAGCAVFWDPRLLHGVRKNPRKGHIVFGMYLGYSVAGSRPEYKKRCGVDEKWDRINSYENGIAPELWPSFDPVHYYPKRFMNFPNIIESYIRKLPACDCSIVTRTMHNGKVVPHLVPVPDPDYTAPQLSRLGRRLLGAIDW